MQKVSLDFETYSEADIKKWGAWGYACHPSTEVICMAYAIGESAPVLWLPGRLYPNSSESQVGSPFMPGIVFLNGVSGTTYKDGLKPG
nr:hypothetical protein [Candidatus Hamiltonella defensa]